MAKPRTNADAVQYWADSISACKPADYLSVNSILVERDTVYSFGRHYPMGKIVRRADGTAKVVVLNNDHYPSRGFANTPGDQHTVQTAAWIAVGNLRGCKLISMPLSAYKSGGMIQAKPKADDPEPAKWSHMEVPRVFYASDPGPEPTDDGVGCVAGEREFYSYQDRRYSWESARYPHTETAHPHRSGWSSGDTRRVWLNGELVFGSAAHSWEHERETGERVDSVEYIQCKHCRDFRFAHRLWSVQMNGGHHPQTYKRVHGYLAYCMEIDRYGSVEAWREAWRTDLRRVRAERTARKEWEARNMVPLDYVSTDANRLPILDSENYPRRKDSERYFKAQRERARQAKRLAKRNAKAARERALIDKVRERRAARRAQRHAKQFETRALTLASELEFVVKNLPSHRKEA